MSSSTFVQTASPALPHIDFGVSAPAATKRWQIKIGHPDFAVLLPIAAALLLVGFGYVAAPLAVHDLPLLLR
jgi:hypothetical protein